MISRSVVLSRFHFEEIGIFSIQSWNLMRFNALCDWKTFVKICYFITNKSNYDETVGIKTRCTKDESNDFTIHDNRGSMSIVSMSIVWTWGQSKVSQYNNVHRSSHTQLIELCQYITYTPTRKYWLQNNFFLKKFLEDISLFCGATDTPVLDFWWYLPWDSKPEWVGLFAFSRSIYTIHFLKFRFYSFPDNKISIALNELLIVLK